MPRRLGRKDLTVKPASKQQNASKRRRIEDDQDNTAKERQKSSASHSTGGAAASRPKTPRLVSDRVLRSTPPGRRDPFDKLGDTEVGLITSFLSARDTEILRRVSKQWKGYSEYFHSTEAAVLRHFPWAAARAKKCGSREEFNLLFRRCVYMEESLKAGRATAWHECEMVSYWNICDDYILWSNMDGEITVCPLSSLGDVAGTNQYDWEELGRPSPASYISCQDMFSEYDEVQQIYLISRSEILLKLLVYPQPGDTYGENATKFVKVSVQGSTLWELVVGPCSSEAAIGRDAMYYFHGPPWAQDDLLIRDASLSKVSLHDGSCIFEKTMPEDLNGVVLDLQGLNFVDKSLSLSDDESLIRWGDEDEAQNICTTSPEQFSVTQWSREEDEWQDAGSPSYLEPGFWELSSSWAKLTTYNKHEDSFKNDRYRLPKPIAASTIWGFDQHYSTMFYLIDDVVQRAQTRKAYRTTAPPAKIGIVKVEENNSKSCLSMRRSGPV